MKYYLSLIVALIALSTAHAQSNSTPTLKSVLLQQFKTTHNVKEWFVPLLTSVKGLTPEQANWKDSTENHSIAQLATHLYFWNKRNLDKFYGKAPDTFSGNNKETFKPVTAETWKTTV